MSRLRFFPTLAGAVGVLALAACVDSPYSPSVAPSTYAPQPPLVTLNGVVDAAGRREHGIILVTTDGDEIRLAGREAERLERVDGAEVEIRGTWDAVDAFVVSDFLVRAVGGVAAMDGVLTEMYGDEYETDFIGYGLRLTRSALVVALVDPPEGLIEHVGDRVWITGVPDAAPIAYGVIGRAVERY